MHRKAEKDIASGTELEEGESSEKLQPQGQYESFVVDTADRQVKIGKLFPYHIKTTIQTTLIEIRDIFSWTPSDLGIILRDTIAYWLGIPDGTTTGNTKEEDICEAEIASNPGQRE